ncbi:GIY-YIG nuclease family protein [Candidatus Contubernalis alkaliaceticus]|uniref:GIY-YIG nuclease family protein n=1 Tax=Candidatus Contubernalis alkaliaceticus TaxID=338645 RepID=UPI001F4BD574|nr:GIY-YIG nuclease family protein [Candidatus Contubernalis alkalaceticus]
MFYVYILECRDGTLYTGWTMDIAKRLAEHNRGNGAKYTRGRYPVAVRYYETFGTKSEAMQREYCIKRLSREEKLKMIAGHSS